MKISIHKKTYVNCNVIVNMPIADYFYINLIDKLIDILHKFLNGIVGIVYLSIFSF